LRAVARHCYQEHSPGGKQPEIAARHNLIVTAAVTAEEEEEEEGEEDEGLALAVHDLLVCFWERPRESLLVALGLGAACLARWPGAPDRKPARKRARGGPATPQAATGDESPEEGGTPTAPGEVAA
jgi:hypothetical protein